MTKKIEMGELYNLYLKTKVGDISFLDWLAIKAALDAKVEQPKGNCNSRFACQLALQTTSAESAAQLKEDLEEFQAERIQGLW